MGALELKRMASLYGVSLEDLLEDPRASGEIPLAVAMRGGVSALGPKAEAMKRRMQRIVSDDRWLREAGMGETHVKAPLVLGMSEDLGDLARGYSGADSFRARYGLGESPIADVAMLADEVGVVVARMPVGVDNASPDGCSALDPETGAAYVLINSDKPRLRRRVTIAHELGHLALGHLHGGEVIVDETVNGTSRQERESNAFAAGLLMPAQGVKGALGRLRDRLGENPNPTDWIVWLAASFGVSEQAAAYRLTNLRLIRSVGGDTAATVRKLVEDPEAIREAKARLGLAPLTPDAERGATEVGPAMRARIARALTMGVISVDGAAAMLHLPSQEVYRWVAEFGIRLGSAGAPLR